MNQRDIWYLIVQKLYVVSFSLHLFFVQSLSQITICFIFITYISYSIEYYLSYSSSYFFKESYLYAFHHPFFISHFSSFFFHFSLFLSSFFFTFFLHLWSLSFFSLLRISSNHGLDIFVSISIVFKIWYWWYFLFQMSLISYYISWIKI